VVGILRDQDLSSTLGNFDADSRRRAREVWREFLGNAVLLSRVTLATWPRRSDRQVAQAVAVMLDQVEGEQHRLTATALTPERMEVRRPISAGDRDLAIDQERLRLEAERGVNDGPEAVGPV
jgi:hypothetical protein